MPYLDVHSARMPSPSSPTTSPSPSPSSPDFAGPEFPTATFSFTVQPVHANRLANLHGGCAATLFDYCTSVALILVAAPGRWQYLGVTRNLACTYLRPVPVGTEILIECEVVSAGRQLSLIRGVMRRKSDGAVLNTCEHGKFNTDPPAKI
jgi:acyl-coenzyme A thioesterase 13